MHNPVRFVTGSLALVTISLAVTGCTVGPDFKVPDAPSVASAHPYTKTELPAQTASADVAGGQSQRFRANEEVALEWWTIYRSPELNELIRIALANSPNLAAAEAALRQAQENYNAQYSGVIYPQVTGSLGANREHTSAATAIPGMGTLFNLYNASVNVSYALDFAGASRRALEGLQASVDYQRFQTEAAYLSLTSNIITTAIQEASLRAQLQATQKVLAGLDKSLNITKKQFSLGAIARSQVLAEQTQVAQAQATLPALEKSLALARNQLSIYVGKLPGEDGLPELQLSTLHLPENLPISLPSQLVRQRPDIRASEELLHQASAQLGIATANQYPQINLTASYGFSGFKTSNLFNEGFNIWSLAAGLIQPIFNGGSLSAKQRAAAAGLQQAEAEYRQTVLSAFQNVSNTLYALDSDARTLTIQAEAARLAENALNLTERQHKLGGVSYLALLDARRAWQQTQISLIQAQAARFANTAALYQALGGGWWNRPEQISMTNNNGAIAQETARASAP